MKKHLLAAAVAAAVAGPVAAQNVSVFGVIDTGVGSLESGAAASSSYTGSVNNVLSTSSLGFRGTEDLGGGLKASFVLRQEFTPSSGTISGRSVITEGGTTSTSANTNDVKSQVDRFTEVAVTVEGNFGTVTLGKHTALARNAAGAGAWIGNAALIGTGNGVTLRQLGDNVDNAVSYTTPSINGFRAQAFRGFQNAASASGATTSAEAKQTTNGVGFSYSAGPLTVGAGQLTRDNVSAATTGSTSDMKTQSIGAGYDFGAARVGVTYIKFDSATNATGDEQKITALQVQVPLTGALSAIGSYHLYDEGSSAASDSAKYMMVGALYNFSKRTNAYAIYGRITNEAAAKYSHAFAASSSDGDDPRTIAVGLRHSF
jgi:predicted porin